MPAIKGVILPDYFPQNKATMTVFGIPTPFTILQISGLEDELDTAELPDRTNGSGGRKKQVEFDITLPAHHVVEIAAMEAWYIECQDPVLPSYKKGANIVLSSQSNLRNASVGLVGVFISKRALPDFDLDNDGEMTTITYTLKADHCSPFFPQ